MQVKKKPRNAAAKKIHKVPPKEKRTKKEQTEQPLLKRVIFGEERPDLTELEAGSTTILDILAPTTVDTKSKDYIVVDGVYHTYLYIMSCESDLSALLADELWSLVGATANPQAAGFVLEMVKTIRGLGGIAVTSTQGMQDLFGLDGGSYGKGILDASRIKLVMQMEEQEARLIQDKLNLSEDEVRQITRFRRGEGLLCIGYNHVPVAFHTTPKEYEAITTSPTDLRRGRSEHGDE